jgi:hypothetical protein
VNGKLSQVVGRRKSRGRREEKLQDETQNLQVSPCSCHVSSRGPRDRVLPFHPIRSRLQFYSFFFLFKLAKLIQ